MWSSASASLLLLSAVALGGCSVTRHAGDLTALVSQAKEESAKQAKLEEEERSYKSLEEAIRRGEVRPGMTEKAVERRFGEPVVEMKEKTGRTWLYQSPDWNWFAARKIYLEFDPSGRLRGWESPTGSV